MKPSFEEIDKQITQTIRMYYWEVKMGLHPPVKAVHSGRVVENKGMPAGWK